MVTPLTKEIVLLIMDVINTSPELREAEKKDIGK